MRLKTQRRAIYAVMGLAMLAMIGGYALASFSMNAPTSVEQGSQTISISGVVGLTYNSTSLMIVEANFTGTTCSAATPCNVSGAAAIDCAGGIVGSATCAQNSFVEQVVLTTVASTDFSGNGTIHIQLFATVGGTTYTTAPFYYQNSHATATAHTITIDFGVGNTTSGPGAVSSVSVVATH